MTTKAILKALDIKFNKGQLKEIEERATEMSTTVMVELGRLGNMDDFEIRATVECICTILATKGYGSSMQKINELRQSAFREGYEQGRFDTRAVFAQQREEPTFKWVKSNIKNEKYRCSKCGGACWYYDYEGDVAKSKYCPNCGAKMEV